MFSCGSVTFDRICLRNKIYSLLLKFIEKPIPRGVTLLWFLWLDAFLSFSASLELLCHSSIHCSVTLNLSCKRNSSPIERCHKVSSHRFVFLILLLQMRFYCQDDRKFKVEASSKMSEPHSQWVSTCIHIWIELWWG